MRELTGLFGIDWLVLFAAFFGLALALMSARRDMDGLRAGRLLVVPLLAGVLLLAGIGLRLSDDVQRFLPSLLRPVTAVLTLAVGFTAVAVADLLFSRLARLPARLWRHHSPRAAGDVGLAAFVAGPALVTLAAVLLLGARVETAPEGRGLEADFAVESVISLPSSPLGLALRGERDGYVSVGGNEVMRFEVRDDSQDSPTVHLETVAEGFSYARDLAVVDDVLVVADLGPLPCPLPFPVCKGQHVPGAADAGEGELRILEESRGRLVAFDIAADGTLRDERVVAADLPVVNSEHGVNGVVAGPDGLVYVAIGHIDHLSLDGLDTVDHPNLDLLGTVVRMAPDGSGFAVFARGLRNVYGLAFDEDGGLWGVDNDGDTPTGWRAEEILMIRQGRHYGFPHDGSFGPGTVRDDWPVWHAEGVGSAALSWLGEVGLGPGLLIGSCGQLDGLRLTRHGEDWTVASRADYARLLDLPGCPTAIEAIGEGRLLVGLFGADVLNVVHARGAEEPP